MRVRGEKQISRMDVKEFFFTESSFFLTKKNLIKNLMEEVYFWLWRLS